MTTRIEVEHPYGTLICRCGNRSEWDFCDDDGNVIEDKEKWRGLYRCAKCGLIAHWPTGHVVRDPTPAE